MCTVTLASRGLGHARLVTNRDVSRARPLADAPQIIDADTVRAVMPIDPQGGGTWVAVNDRGLIVTLLNLSVEGAGNDKDQRPQSAPRSRGEIVHGLAFCETLSHMRELLARFDAHDFEPFRVLAYDPAAGEGFVRRSIDPRNDFSLISQGDLPTMLASSGLGDALVESPRERLFLETRDRFDEPAQDAFHRHRWDDRGLESVLMSREAARTVSITAVEVGSIQVTMSYRPVDESGKIGQPHVVGLGRAGVIA